LTRRKFRPPLLAIWLPCSPNRGWRRRTELKALGIELPTPQPSGLTPFGKNLLDQLK